MRPVRRAGRTCDVQRAAPGRERSTRNEEYGSHAEWRVVLAHSGVEDSRRV
jgi:hypothetical protein